MEQIDLRAYRAAAFRLAHERLREALARGAAHSLALRDATDALIGRYDLTWHEWDALIERLVDVTSPAEAERGDER